MTEPSDVSAKAALRLHARNLRKAFVREHAPADWRAGEQAGRMLSALFGEAQAPGVIALYRAHGSEIDPQPLAETLIQRGWRLALPHTEAFDAPMTFRAWAPGEPLAADLMGVAAPLASAPEIAPDVVIAPLIAFDRQGGRLGQGGGYYDRTLDALRAKGHAPAFVGLAFSIQEVDHVPMESHDQRLDGILTEKTYIGVPKDI